MTDEPIVGDHSPFVPIVSPPDPADIVQAKPAVLAQPEPEQPEKKDAGEVTNSLRQLQYYLDLDGHTGLAARTYDALAAVLHALARFVDAEVEAEEPAPVAAPVTLSGLPPELATQLEQMLSQYVMK